MISGITTVCFAASYAVALALELTRPWFRSRVRGFVMLGFAAAGLFAHTVFLANRAATSSRIPLSSPYDWYLLTAWVLVVAYLYLTFYHPTVPSGIFVLPLVLALIGASRFASGKPFVESRTESIWGMIHGVFLSLGAAAVIIGFVAGLMYLIQANRLKQKRLTGGGLRLPSLEWLERVNSRAIVISLIMTGLGLLAGLVLNLLTRRNEVPWSDPIVWQSAVMFGWLLAVALFSGLYRPARQGRKVAYLTVASFVFLAIFLVVRLFGQTEHGGRTAAWGARRGAWTVLPLPKGEGTRGGPIPIAPDAGRATA